MPQILDKFWSRVQFASVQIKELYLPNNGGVMTKITATADEINALNPKTAPPAGSVTNASMANDVKIGSLASLATTIKTSIQAAIYEVVANVGALSGLTTTAKNTIVAALNEVDAGYKAKYSRPALGIPSGDMTAAVQTSLGKADTASLAMKMLTELPVLAAVVIAIAAEEPDSADLIRRKWSVSLQVRLTTPERTCAPGATRSGIGSPVMREVSSELVPCTTSPSQGTISPGRSLGSTDPTSGAFGECIRRPLPSTTVWNDSRPARTTCRTSAPMMMRAVESTLRNRPWRSETTSPLRAEL